jgi:prepilin-type N-terminal cleavage/methylation domain-containing protein
MRRPLRKSCQRASRGLSLLELVVAMAIGSVLLSAVWSMFSMITMRHERETLKAEETQLVRSLHQMMSRDLARVVPQQANSGPGVQSSSMSLPLFAPNSVGGAVGISWSTGTVPSLRGTSDRLELVCFAEPSLEPPQETQGERSNENSKRDVLPPSLATCSVVYIWEDDQRSESGAVATGENRDERERKRIRRPGLTRIEGGSDRHGAGLRPGTEDTVREFYQAAIQYYDGNVWQTSWDSGVSGRLPVAIRLQFCLKMKYVAEDDSDPASAENSAEEDAFEPDVSDQLPAESDADACWRNFVLLVAPSSVNEPRGTTTLERIRGDRGSARRPRIGIGVDAP